MVPGKYRREPENKTAQQLEDNLHRGTCIGGKTGGGAGRKLGPPPDSSLKQRLSVFFTSPDSWSVILAMHFPSSLVIDLSVTIHDCFCARRLRRRTREDCRRRSPSGCCSTIGGCSSSCSSSCRLWSGAAAASSASSSAPAASASACCGQPSKDKPRTCCSTWIHVRVVYNFLLRDADMHSAYLLRQRVCLSVCLSVSAVSKRLNLS